MSLNSSKSHSKSKSSHGSEQQGGEHPSPPHQQTLPYGQHGHKRPDTLVGTARSLGKKKGSQIKTEMVRHSMDLDDRMITSTGAMSEQTAQSDFRTRSQTLTDLNNMDQPQDADGEGGSQSGSQSTIASGDVRTGNAKLLHSSNNPVTYSNTNITKDSLGSPIWKQRGAPGKKGEAESVEVPERAAQVRSPAEAAAVAAAAAEKTASSKPYIPDYSEVQHDEKQKSVILEQHRHVMLFSHEDTEC